MRTGGYRTNRTTVDISKQLQYCAYLYMEQLLHNTWERLEFYQPVPGTVVEVYSIWEYIIIR